MPHVPSITAPHGKAHSLSPHNLGEGGAQINCVGATATLGTRPGRGRGIFESIADVKNRARLGGAHLELDNGMLALLTNDFS